MKFTHVVVLASCASLLGVGQVWAAVGNNQSMKMHEMRQYQKTQQQLEQMEKIKKLQMMKNAQELKQIQSMKQKQQNKLRSKMMLPSGQGRGFVDH